MRNMVFNVEFCNGYLAGTRDGWIKRCGSMTNMHLGRYERRKLSGVSSVLVASLSKASRNSVQPLGRTLGRHDNILDFIFFVSFPEQVRLNFYSSSSPPRRI